ncbi:MAG: hypothetical protein ACTSRI_19240 [Promethearchaeota archaeon]
MPSYDDIIQDLKLKKNENHHHFRVILRSIDKVFICEDADRILDWIKKKHLVLTMRKH